MTKVGQTNFFRTARGAISVRPNGQSSRPRNFIVVRGIGPTHTLGVFNNNIRTVQRALTERYLTCEVNGEFTTPLSVRPRAYVANKWLQDFRMRIVDKCKDAPVVPSRHVVNAYTGPKRLIYEAARVSLLQKPLEAKDARLTSFAKFEKQDLGKAPRAINPRSARYNLRLGKYLKFIEKRVYRAINKTFGSVTRHTVIKGLNVQQVGDVALEKWRRFKRPVAVGLDAKKFDMHVTVEALKFEHSVYTDIFPKSRELRDLLRLQLHNKGMAYCDDGKVKFRMKGTRSSGDLNTSLGNCIIMCALIFGLLKHISVDAELMNNGDDCVLILEHEHLETLQRAVVPWFTRFGFRIEVEPAVYEFEQIDFCQSSPVMVGPQPVMVRNVATCIKKDPMCLVPINTERVLRYWYKAVGDCGSSISVGMPVMSEYYKMYQRSGVNYSEGFMQQVFKGTSQLQRAHNLKEIGSRILPETRCSFFYTTGITPAHQIALEAFYAGVTLTAGVQTLLNHDVTMDKGLNLCPPVVQSLY